MFTIPDMKAFNILVTASNNLNQEIVFHAEAGKLSVKTWATHTASGLVFSIPITGEQTTEVFAVKTDDILKAIKSLGDHASFSIEGNRLTIKGGNKTHRLAIYDEQHVKELKSTVPHAQARFTLKVKEFLDTVKEARTYSKTLRFTVENGSFTMKSIEQGIQNDVEVSLAISSDAKARCHYNGEFFEDISGFAKLFDTCECSFNTTYPFVTTFSKDDIRASFFVAPIGVDYD